MIFLSRGHSLRWLRMSWAIVAAIRCHSLHWSIPRHSPLKPLFVCYSKHFIWCFSLGVLLFSALNNLSYLLLLMCQIQKEQNKTNKKKKLRNNCMLRCPWSRNSFLKWKKVFCGTSETNIQLVKCICLWHSLSVTPQAEATWCVEEWRDCIVFIPKWL